MSRWRSVSSLAQVIYQTKIGDAMQRGAAIETAVADTVSGTNIVFRRL